MQPILVQFATGLCAFCNIHSTLQ